MSEPADRALRNISKVMPHRWIDEQWPIRRYAGVARWKERSARRRWCGFICWLLSKAWVRSMRHAANAKCPLSGICAKQIGNSAGEHETYWGMVPSHSRLFNKLMHQYSHRTISGFNTAKNRFRSSGFFINSLELA